MSFKLWFETQNPAIRISVSGYEQSLRKIITGLRDFEENEKDRLQNFRFDPKVVDALRSINYPNIKSLETAVASRNPRMLNFAAMRLQNWQMRQKIYGLDTVRNAIRHLWDYASVLEPHETSPEEWERYTQELVGKTQQNMERIAAIIREAVGRIPNWMGSPITISANTPNRENTIDAETDANVSLGNIAGFTIFMDGGNYRIDDITEGDEAFDSISQKADYFTLIKELQHPGSSSRGRTLTLYTARPAKDRQRYLDARTVPVNIYLTTKLSTAESFGDDFNEKRDIWRVRINSRYLMVTLDMPGEKQYQVIGPPEVPIESMELLSTGDNEA
jgi:hypothetical protein